mgnify:CR=1 FL=1
MYTIDNCIFPFFLSNIAQSELRYVRLKRHFGI